MSQVKPINKEELKLYDVQKKLNVARHIATACMKNTIKKYDIRKNDFYLEAQNYISSSKLLTSAIFEKIEKMDKPRTFSDWFQEISNEHKDSINDTTAPIDILLRNALIDHYVNMQRLPNISSICKYLNKDIPLTETELKIILKTKGYKTQRLPRSNLTIIVEDPEQCHQRMFFCHNIINLRELKYNIVYVDEKIYNNLMGNGETIQILVAASSKAGIISETINQVMFRPRANNIKNMIAVDDWIIDNVLPQLSKSSVIVLGNVKNIAKKLSNIPTIYSPKAHMVNWLQQNDIPHSTEMHTAELFELIKRSKCKFPSKKCKLDEILMGYGHKVLRRPKRTQSLNIFESIWKQILDNFTKENKSDLVYFIKRSLFSISTSQWNILESNLIKTEVDIYNEDGAVEDVIDKIFTYAKYRTVPHSYLEKCDEDIDELKMAEIVLV